LAGIIRSSDPAASLQVAADDDDAAAVAGAEDLVGRGAPSLSTTSGANRTRFSPLRLLAFAFAFAPRGRLSDDKRQGRRACSGAPSSGSGSGSGSGTWERCARQSEKMTREPENATAVAAASAREPPIDDDDDDDEDMDDVATVKPSR